jgi:hypothetical protein
LFLSAHSCQLKPLQAPFLKSELIDLGVLSKQYTLLMTGDHNKARQWSSQLGSETATKDVPLPQEVENFLESGLSFLDKRREYIKKTAAEAAKKEHEVKRVCPFFLPSVLLLTLLSGTGSHHQEGCGDPQSTFQTHSRMFSYRNIDRKQLRPGSALVLRV